MKLPVADRGGECRRCNRLTADQFNEWAGSDDGATREFVVELLLDIVNGVYAIDDFLSDVKQYE